MYSANLTTTKNENFSKNTGRITEIDHKGKSYMKI